MHNILLASTSRFRRALLDRVGLTYSAEAPPYDEVTEGLESRTPIEIAQIFAEGKARALFEKHIRDGEPLASNTLIISADQVAEYEGQLLKKPETLERVESELARLQGKTHSLHTAVACLNVATGQLEMETTSVTLQMRPLTAEQIHTYVTLDEPIGCVGGYRIESRGVWIFEEIAGQEESAIVGLPLLLVGRLLRRFGCDPLCI